MSLAPTPSHGSRVYGPRRGHVKAELGGLAWLVAAVVCGVLERPATAAAPVEPVARSDDHYRIGIRYPVEPARRAAGERFPQCLDRDFARIRDLGFDTVWVAHVADDDRALVLNAARAARLDLILPDRPILYYVRTGQPSAGQPSLDALLEQRIQRLPSDAPVALLDLGTIADAASRRRAADVAQRLAPLRPQLGLLVAPAGSDGALAEGLGTIVPLRRADTRSLEGVPKPEEPQASARAVLEQRRLLDGLRAAPPGLGSGEPPAPALAPAFAWVPIRQLTADPEAFGEHLMRAFHECLAAGCTAGLLLDAYAEPPGCGAGLVDDEGSLPVRRSAAVKRLITRVRAWGPLLYRSSAHALPDARSLDPDLRTALLSRDRRRFLLLWNATCDRFIHGTLSFSDAPIGQPARRAVQVPGDTGVLGGDVVDGHDGRIELRVDLPPGDANLFELF